MQLKITQKNRIVQVGTPHSKGCSEGGISITLNINKVDLLVHSSIVIGKAIRESGTALYNQLKLN